MESTQKDKDNSSLTVKAVAGALVGGVALLVLSSQWGVESFKIKDCLVQDKSIKGCEFERHSNMPSWAKIALDVLGSSLITSALTIAFLELALRKSNKSLLDETIRLRHDETIKSIDNNFSQKIEDSHEKIKKIIKNELVTTKDIHEFYPLYSEYVSKICEILEQNFDSKDSRKSKIDIIETGGMLLRDINYGLCSKVLCGWKVRLLIANKNDQTVKDVESLRSSLKERIEKEKDSGPVSKNVKDYLGSIEVNYLLDSSQSLDYFSLDNISNDNSKENLLLMRFHEADGNISLPGFNIANPSVRKKLEIYFDSRLNTNLIEHGFNMNRETEFPETTEQPGTKNKSVATTGDSLETEMRLNV